MPKDTQQDKPQEDNAGFDELLEFLKRTRGFDFGAYKRPSLMRRVRRRMDLIGIQGFGEYLDRLQVDPGEFAELFDSILINVTSFFRDPEAWQFIQSEVIPQIIEKKQTDEAIRVWSAGCASGEEAYTLAMALGEALGADACRDRVKIYATDIDEDALNLARQASYPVRSLADVPPELVDKYFEPPSNGSEKRIFNREIRRCVIFGRHDLLQDAPIPRVDLLVCRNTLMYFNSEAHDRVLARFYFAINPGGFLFLGRAEMLIAHGSLFTPLDLKRRVFVPAPKSPLRDRLLLLSQNGRMDTVNHLVSHVREPRACARGRFRR